MSIASQRHRAEQLSVIAFLTMVVALGPISTDLYLPSLPSIGVALGSDTAGVQLTLSVFLAGFAVSQLIYGPLSDRYGRRPVLLIALLIYFMATVACCFADSIEWLIAARFAQALGACAGPVVGRAVVRDVFGRDRSARVLSYMATAVSVAPAVGPIIGGYLEIGFGWRASFIALGVFGALAFAGIYALLPETNVRRDPTATRPGKLISNYFFLMRTRHYVGCVLICTFSYSGIFSFISGSPFILIETIQLSPSSYGLCFTAVVIGYMLGSFTSGRLTQRVGTSQMILTGTVLQCVGGMAGILLAMFGILDVYSIVGPTFVFLIGTGLAMPNAMASAIGPFPQMAGTASALLGFTQMTVAAVVGIAVGHSGDGTAFGMMGSIALVSILGLLSFVFLLGRKFDSRAGDNTVLAPASDPGRS
ncbi:multidrug effflux MFS transporter [Pelagibius sp. Alg239-R121]|uniref:multidrug effflux MFS transporter n=1 Tax=Pelagibius sp. Alg239-R121 TaxID=2993448 RepID=UPI0024A727CD|nr:multidrug effflux MFS transporter [Pelagibius sp. Alg239-R121]